MGSFIPTGEHEGTGWVRNARLANDSPRLDLATSSFEQGRKRDDLGQQGRGIVWIGEKERPVDMPDDVFAVRIKVLKAGQL